MMDDIVKLDIMDSSSTLFEKTIPVRVMKLPGSDDRLMELTVRIVMGISKPHRSSKLLRVQLTNEADPFFLYFLEVSEEDFQTLKVEQCILVDFTTFPYKFIELLEHCINDAGSHDTPRFKAILHVRTGDSTFSIVEANQFKNLSHLSLCFRQGNDSTIKTYLAGRLAEFKNANVDMHEKLRRTLASLEMALRDNGNLSSELSELRENNSTTMNQLKAEYALELAHEKEKAIQEYTDAKEKFVKERSDLESHLRQQAETHQEKVLELEKQVRTLLESKHAVEVRIGEVNTHITILEKDLDEKIQECERLRTENHNFDAERQAALNTLNQHLVRLGALDQEVQDKTELITSLQKQLEEQTLQRSSLEISFKDSQIALHRAEDKNKINEAELNKCRQSIEKLQAKVKLKGKMASQQDNLLIERQTAIDRMTQENNDLKQEMVVMKDDNDSLRKKVEELQCKVDESQELQQSSQQMIQWLNQQLTDAQLGKLGTIKAPSRSYNPTRPNLSFLANSSDTTTRGTLSNQPNLSFLANSSDTITRGTLSNQPNLSFLTSSGDPTMRAAISNQPNLSLLSSSNDSMMRTPSTNQPNLSFLGSSNDPMTRTTISNASNLSFLTNSSDPITRTSYQAPNLSFLSNSSDTMTRATSNRVGGPSFSASASLNMGPVSYNPTYKNMLQPASSPPSFDRLAIHDSMKANIGSSSVSNGNNMSSSILPLINSTRPLRNDTSPPRAASVTATTLNMKPMGHNTTNSDQFPVTCVANKSVFGLLDNQLNSSIAEPGDLALPKDENSSWTLLPRPPLSFVEARSELHKWTGKYKTSCGQDKNIKSNNEKNVLSNINNIESEDSPGAEDKTSAH